MSKDYIFEPRPVYSSHTPNLFLGSYYIEDDFQADPSMWADPLEDAFVTNSGMKEGKIESVTNLNEFSAETVLMGTNKLDTSEVIPQSYFWKWDNYESHLQIPTQISEDDFESSAYEQFLEVALGYHSDEDPYFLLVVKSFMDEGDDPDIWAEEADWTRIQTTKRWWEIYDQWMDVGGVDFLLDKADDDYDWAMSNAGDLQMIGWEMPLPDDDDFYFRQAENESHWMTFGQVDYNWATDPYDVELTDEEFSNIDEQIRNEVRYEIDTNNLPGESNISSWTLSLTEDDEDDFTIYYYWGSAKTTGVNSAESFEADVITQHRPYPRLHYSSSFCWKCGDATHHYSKCKSSKYDEALTRKKEMLKEVNAGIKLIGSYNPTQWQPKIQKQDLEDLRELRRMIKNNHFGIARHYFNGLDTNVRDHIGYGSRIDMWELESFEAPYTGAGALMGISGDSDLSSFTSKELTESSAIHGDFDQASLNYSGHQNLEVRAESPEICLACNGVNKDPETHGYCENCRVKCEICGTLLDEDTDGENYENENCGSCYVEAGIVPEWMGNSYYVNDYLKDFSPKVLEEYGYDNPCDCGDEDNCEHCSYDSAAKKAESFASEGPYECGQCREYGDYDPGEAPAVEEECDDCGDSICIGCYEAGGGLCMRCDGQFMSENDYFYKKYGGIYEDGRSCPVCALNNMAENACGTPGNDMCNDCCAKSGGCGHCMSE